MMKSRFRYNIKKQSKIMSEINVTPFVDVMLVLLIIFMITAPLMKTGIEIELPEVLWRINPTKIVREEFDPEYNNQHKYRINDDDVDLEV